MRLSSAARIVVTTAFILIGLSSGASLAAGKIEALLNELGIPSVDAGDGDRRAVYADEGKSVTMLVTAKNLGNDPNNDGLKLIRIQSLLAQLPKDAKPSAAAMAKINELNANLSVGKIYVTQGMVIYHSAFWYVTTDATQMAKEIQLAWITCTSAGPVLEPFFKEE